MQGLWDRAYDISILSEKTRRSNGLQMPFQSLGVGAVGVWPSGLSLGSLHNRRLMSQARRTLQFARSARRAPIARRGEEKTIIFSSPLVSHFAQNARLGAYLIELTGQRSKPNSRSFITHEGETKENHQHKLQFIIKVTVIINTWYPRQGGNLCSSHFGVPHLHVNRP